MATGRYTSNLEDLSVQVPGTIEPENTATGDHVTIELYNGEGDYDFVKAKDTRNPANTYVMYFAKSGNFKGEIHCEAKSGNEKAKQLCLSYGPSNAGDPITGTDSDYEAYILQGTGDGTGSGVSTGYDWQCNGSICWAYDTNGKAIGYRECVSFDSEGKCSSYGSGWDYTYDGNKTFARRCADLDSKGKCTSYSEGRDTTYDADGNPISWRGCSNFDSEWNCADYNDGRDNTYNAGKLIRTCSCLGWEGFACTGGWSCINK